MNVRKSGTSRSRFRHRQEKHGSLDDYRYRKLLPHITQQYDYRITNRLLVQKIINPRRDKTIMESLINAVNKNSISNMNKLSRESKNFAHRRKLVESKMMLKPNQSFVNEKIDFRKSSESTVFFENEDQAIGRFLISQKEDEKNQTFCPKKYRFFNKFKNTLHNKFVGRIIKNGSHSTLKNVNKSECFQSSRIESGRIRKQFQRFESKVQVKLKKVTKNSSKLCENKENSTQYKYRQEKIEKID